MAVSRKRHFVKALTYRILGSTFSACLCSVIIGDIVIGGIIGICDFIFKIVVYYLHERFWYKYIKWGVDSSTKI